MKTVTIKLAIEAEVPVGEYCLKKTTSYSYKGNIKITSEETEVEKCRNLLEGRCSIFPLFSVGKPGWMGIGITSWSSSDINGNDTVAVLKCPACLDACKGGE